MLKLFFGLEIGITTSMIINANTSDGNYSFFLPDLCPSLLERTKDWYGYTNFVFRGLSLIYIYIDWINLYKKSHHDILQGISKLDNILKVSVIQKYKRGLNN